MAPFRLVSDMATGEDNPLWGTHGVGCGKWGKCVHKEYVQTHMHTIL